MNPLNPKATVVMDVQDQIVDGQLCGSTNSNQVAFGNTQSAINHLSAQQEISAELFLVSNREVADQIVRPVTLNANRDVIKAMADHINDGVSVNNFGTMNTSFAAKNPLENSQLIYPGTDAMEAKLSEYSHNWTYMLILHCGNRNLNSTREIYSGYIAHSYGDPITSDGYIDPSAELIPNRHVSVSSANLPLFNNVYDPVTGESRRTPANKVNTFVNTDEVYVDPNAQKQVQGYRPDINLYTVNVPGATSMLKTEMYNSHGVNDYNGRVYTTPVQNYDRIAMSTKYVSPMLQSQSLADNICNGISSCEFTSGADCSIMGLSVSENQIVDKMDHHLAIDGNVFSDQYNNSEITNNGSYRHLLRELVSVYGDKMRIVVLRIPYANTLDLDLQNDNSPRSIYSALLAQSIYAMCSQRNIASIAFRYDSVNFSQPDEGFIPRERQYRGVWKVMQYATLTPVPSDEQITCIRWLQKSLMDSVFPTLLAANGDFSLIVMYDHMQRTVINLNFFADQAWGQQPHTDYLEYPSSFLGITAPVISTNQHLRHNADALSKIISGTTSEYDHRNSQPGDAYPADVTAAGFSYN